MRTISNLSFALQSPAPTIDWAAPDFSPAVSVAGPTHRYRLWHVREIGALGAIANRLAMSNVVCSLSAAHCASIYLLAGRPEGVSLYLGIGSDDERADLPEAAKAFRAAFEGNFLGARLQAVNEDDGAIGDLLKGSRHLGMMTGVPTFDDHEARQDGDDFQGVERVVNVMAGETWQLAITAQPGSEAELDEIIQALFDLSAGLSTRARETWQETEQTVEDAGSAERQSRNEARTERKNKSGESSYRAERTETKGDNTKSEAKSDASHKTDADSITNEESINKAKDDTSSEGKNFRLQISKSRELRDRRNELLQEHVHDTLLDRFLQGRAKGMFRTTMFIATQTHASYERLARTVLAVFQDSRPNLTPLRMHKMIEPARTVLELLAPRFLAADGIRRHDALVQSIPCDERQGLAQAGSWLTARELAGVAGVPNIELPGLKLRASVDFGLNAVPAPHGECELVLGHIVQNGRLLVHRPLFLAVRDLNKHVFITGVTGAGKTTTCMKLLLESGLPFLVIEPAKTEYRALHALAPETEYYILGREDLTPFRLNPFEMVEAEHINLAGHVSQLTATLAAVFPMEAAMPFLVEEAIINAYKTRGWDVHAGKNFLHLQPWAEGSTAWPTFSDMLRELDGVIVSKRMGEDFTAKYRGSLVAQLSNLTLGVKGRMLNTPRSMNFDLLLNGRVVIELEEIKNDLDKALFMGLIISRIADCMKQRHRKNKHFRHLTLVEEAHRLLSRLEPGEGGARKVGVEMFANLLAEVRKYGEGLIIADQIPNKLIPDVIKNTNIKIVHRLFAADDRHAIGDTMGLTDRQKNFLPLLQQGQAVVYCGGWHAPILTQVIQGADTSEAEIPEATFRKRGRLQLDRHKRLLWPHLAGCAELADPDHFGTFLHDGGSLLNLLLRLNNDTSEGRTFDRLRGVFLDRYARCGEQHGAALDRLLCCLLMDTAQIDLAAFPPELCVSIIAEGIAALHASPVDFCQLVEHKSPAKHLFHRLRDFDSL